jgi:hypothetical protein
MSRLSVKGAQVLLIVALCAANGWGQAAQPRASVKGHYLLVWAGDRAKLGNDFLAVIDAVDTDFRDTDGKPGFSFAERDWPHGWKGAAKPHGAVFTR